MRDVLPRNQFPGHGGKAVARAIQEALGRAPWNLRIRDFQASLSLVGGDGAIVRGGIDRKQPGTSAAEYFWIAAHPELDVAAHEDLPLAGLEDKMSFRLKDNRRLWFGTEWDKMHREDKRIARAISACPLGDHFSLTRT